MDINKLFFSILFATVLSACLSCSGSGEDPYVPSTEPETPTTKTLNININPAVSAPEDTRATDKGFEAGDKTGLFVVNRKADGTAGNLAVSGNHVDNMCYTYSGKWMPSTAVYWTDNTTHSDLYLYYPYTATVQSVTAMPFTLGTDQSTESGYKACDVITGSATDKTPSENAVTINARHAMSQILVTLEPGTGFTEGTLAAANASVSLNGIQTQATVNLQTGTATAAGGTANVIPLKTADGYKAFIVPQTVTEGDLISVTIDGHTQSIRQSATFTGGKRHRMTVKVDKAADGLNVSLSKWDDDGKDYGGKAE